MLWGHAIQYCAHGDFDFFENWAFKAIYSFHMPLFMLISGYLFWFSFKKRNLKELLIHKVQTMLQPILLYSAFSFILTTVVCFLLTGKGIGSIFQGGMFGASIGSIWFLCSVLAASVAVAVCGKISNKDWLQIVLVLLGVCIAAVFPNRDMNLYMYPYFVIGFFFAKYRENIPKFILNAKFVSLIVFPIMLLFYTKDHYIYTTGLHILQYNDLKAIGIDMFRWSIGLIGCIFTITLAQVVFHLLRKTQKKQLPFELFENLGEKSLQVYCLQRTFLEAWLPSAYGIVINHIFKGSNILADNMTLYNIVYTPLIAVTYSVGLLFVIRILKKIKVSSVIFGR